MKNTVISFAQAKQNRRKIAMLTAYDYSSARIMDEAGIDGILVGDSVGMVFSGYKSTLAVTMEDMIYHTKAVVKGSSNALIIADMPFMSYQISVCSAISNAGRLIKEGQAETVKLEGGREVCPQIKGIVEAGIPVMGHLGLTPQSVHVFGGYKTQGKEEKEAQKILDAAKAVEEAGAFSVVLECIPHQLAEKITQSISIPTIGIGGGDGCDGQIMVSLDMLGMFPDFRPKFVKQYMNMGEQMKIAFQQYIEEVQKGIFPGDKERF